MSHQFNSTELHELWLRYHSGKLGLSGLTASSFLSWDEFLARETKSRNIEQRWLAADINRQLDTQPLAPKLASGLNVSQSLDMSSNMSPVSPISPTSVIERVTVEAKRSGTCCGCVA